LFGFVGHIYSEGLLKEIGMGLILSARQSNRADIKTADQV